MNFAALMDSFAAAGDLIADPEVLESYRHDQAAPGLLTVGMPVLVVRPRTVAEVQAAVLAARAAGMPLVARGAGSGLSGGANAVDGCVVISFERMSAILDIDAGAMTATVQPGVINDALRVAARSQALWYAPDPASAEFCTIGGNIATNAGGLCCVKYGVTRESLLALQVVLADGRAARIGHPTRKGVAGYDLVSLFCGSEGTLGLVTEATLRLQPLPPSTCTFAATFPTAGSAGRAASAIMLETTPSLLELMDRTTIGAVESYRPMELDPDAGAMLFGQSDIGPGALPAVERMAELCEQEGASLVVTSDDPAEGRMLLAARRMAYSALERVGSTILDDVCVPLGAIGNLVDGVTAISERLGVTVATFGHAGDGNMHPTIAYDRTDLDETARARRAFNEILDLALALGGTITGEHGVGLLKQPALAADLAEAHDLHLRIRHAMDPDGLLNPGKAV